MSASIERSPSNSRRIVVYGAADDMGEHVETATMGDPDENLVRPAARGELDGLVEHRDEDVEPLDRELLLPDERATEVRLERLDPCEATQELPPLLCGELACGTGRTRSPASATRARRGRRCARSRRRWCPCRPRGDEARASSSVSPGTDEPEQPGRDARLQLGRQRRLQPGLVERRVAHRLRPQRIEAGVQVPVRPVRLHE